MPEKLIAGSTAIKYFYPDFREPKDTDYISEDNIKPTRAEENIWIPELQELIDRNKDEKYLDPELSLTLKCSHFGFDIKWTKHEFDILFLKKKGLKMDKELYKILAEGWKKFHGAKWATLADKSAKMFFADAVPRKFDHDGLHEVVANYDAPLYYQIRESENSVKCLESKFNELSYEDKILLIKEEVYVTALERYLIINDFKYSSARAYWQSLRKLVTTMSAGGAKGWFKLFMIDNYENLCHNTDNSYIEKFKTAEKEGKLKLAQTPH